jgi:hypothetical protein
MALGKGAVMKIALRIMVMTAAIAVMPFAVTSGPALAQTPDVCAGVDFSKLTPETQQFMENTCARLQANMPGEDPNNQWVVDPNNGYCMINVGTGERQCSGGGGIRG